MDVQIGEHVSSIVQEGEGKVPVGSIKAWGVEVYLHIWSRVKMEVSGHIYALAILSPLEEPPVPINSVT
jgi:hypothetical protein